MDLFEKIANLAKRRGFIYPGSEIYGGLSGTWDYGPLGAELKRNIKNEYWRFMTREHDNIVGLDAAIIMNPKVWEASGHLESFSDPLIECKQCHARFRADSFVVPDTKTKNYKEADKKFAEKIASSPGIQIEKTQKDFPCPRCDSFNWTEPKSFNLMVETYLGVVEGEKLKTYLRGEITQGVHVNFKNVIDSTRVKVPFGILQVGKAFRNEITPGGLTFRSREFEQMELQFYVAPDEAESMKWMEYWKAERFNWYLSLGMNQENLRFKDHENLAHYARAATDIEYNAGGEWKEMEGIHHRGEWDLSRHAKFSGQDLTFFDEENKQRFTPWVIETSGGVDRATLFFLMDAYREEETKPGETRTVLKLHPRLAPYLAAVFPLLSNKPELVKKAREIYESLRKDFSVAWDERGNIGKRYRTQDEVGTPFCLTVDFDSLEKNDVTVRNRDTMQQERVPLSELKNFLSRAL